MPQLSPTRHIAMSANCGRKSNGHAHTEVMHGAHGELGVVTRYALTKLNFPAHSISWRYQVPLLRRVLLCDTSHCRLCYLCNPGRWLRC